MLLALSVQFLVTLFLAGGLFFKENQLKNKTLGLYLLFFAIELAYYVYGTSAIASYYPQFVGRCYFTIGMLYGPLLWLHFLAIKNPSRLWQIKDLWHLLPVILVNLHMWDIIIMPDQQRVHLFNDPEQFLSRIMIYNYIRAAHQFFYGLLLIAAIRRSLKHISITDRFYLIGIGLIYIATTIIITLLTLFARSWYDFSWYYLICTAFVGLVLWTLYRNPKFFKAIKAKYQHSSLSESDMRKLANRLEQQMQQTPLYLDNSLTIDSLAVTLGMKSHHISQTLSRIPKENFNDFINKYRIAHAKRLLQSDSYANYKIEAIAEESGFNNKVTFYNAFKKWTGTTPSKFRKQAQNE